MNVLIVHAHPESKSFTTAMKDAAVEELTTAGHRVQVSDLYAMNFQPVASAADFTAPASADYLVYALEQRRGYESRTLAPDIATEVDRLLSADLILLSFPLFWFSVPAIMKGWIDRVLLSGVCYGGRRFYDRGGLRNKKMLAAFTMGGPEHMFGPQAIHGELGTMLRPLLQGTFYYVGCAVLPPFVAWHVPYVTHEIRQTYLRDYRRYLAGIESLEPLRLPQLDHYDERFQLRERQAAQSMRQGS